MRLRPAFGYKLVDASFGRTKSDRDARGVLLGKFCSHKKVPSLFAWDSQIISDEIFSSQFLMFDMQQISGCKCNQNPGCFPRRLHELIVSLLPRRSALTVDTTVLCGWRAFASIDFVDFFFPSRPPLDISLIKFVSVVWSLLLGCSFVATKCITQQLVKLGMDGISLPAAGQYDVQFHIENWL